MERRRLQTRLVDSLASQTLYLTATLGKGLVFMIKPQKALRNRPNYSGQSYYPVQVCLTTAAFSA